jgi:hypothetical protein
MAENPEKDRCSEQPHASSSEESSAWNPVQVPGRDGFGVSRPGNVQPSDGGSASESDAWQPKVGEPQASLQDSAADPGVTNAPPTLQEPGVPQNSWAQPQQPTSDLNHTQTPGQNDQLPQYWSQYAAYQASGQGSNDADFAKLRTVRTQITAANVCGPVSLIIGGVTLSTVGIVCAVLAWRSAKRIAESDSPSAPMANNLRKSSLVSIVICCIALVLNGISVALTLPALLEAVNTGDVSQLLGSAPLADSGLSGSTGESSGGSAWG